MAHPKPDPSWPPENGASFIRSDRFGRLLIDVVKQFSKRYPSMDFSDAVAHVFAWFHRKLSRNRRFINARRFPTRDAFRAYLKQAVWNAALLAQRKRQRHEQIEALPVDQPIVAREPSPQERDRLFDLVENLTEPHKTVFERYFFAEEDPSSIASILGLTEDEVHRLYEEAVDLARRKTEALPVDQPIVAREPGPQEHDRLLDIVESLSEPHKTVFERILDKEDPSWIASILGLTEDEIHRLYEEAVDQIARDLT